MKRHQLDRANKHALDYISRYQNLRIYDQTVNTPYYINNLGIYVFTPMLELLDPTDENKKKFLDAYKNCEMPFGWYRGKGTPEQLEEAVLSVSEEVHISLKRATAFGVVEFMKLYGLGVDCSGFVFNTLLYTFEKLGISKEFMSSLNWANPEKQGVNYAGAFTFAGEMIPLIDPSELQPLDLILIKGSRVYNHVAMVISQNDILQMAQSNLDSIPNGVSLSQIDIKDKGPFFHFEPQIATDWNTYVKKGVIEFRRFHFLS